MSTIVLAVGLSYIAIGLVLALIYTFILNRSFSGRFWGAAVVAIVGAFAGGIIDFFFSDIIEELASINGILNVFPPIIAAAVLLSGFARLSERKDPYD